MFQIESRYGNPEDHLETMKRQYSGVYLKPVQVKDIDARLWPIAEKMNWIEKPPRKGPGELKLYNFAGSVVVLALREGYEGHPWDQTLSEVRHICEYHYPLVQNQPWYQAIRERTSELIQVDLDQLVAFRCGLLTSNGR
jgi:hypothetical protein